jgi:heme exporter protein D
MIWVWVAVGFSVVSLTLVFALALLKVAAHASNEAQRAVQDELWASAPPTRARAHAEDDAAVQDQVVPLKSKR